MAWWIWVPVLYLLFVLAIFGGFAPIFGFFDSMKLREKVLVGAMALVLGALVEQHVVGQVESVADRSAADMRVCLAVGPRWSLFSDWRGSSGSQQNGLHPVSPRFKLAGLTAGGEM